MLGVGNLGENVLLLSTDSAGALTCSISYALGTQLQNNQRRDGPGSLSRRWSLKEHSRISGIWEDADPPPKRNDLPATVRAGALWEGCGSRSQKSLMWRPHLCPEVPRAAGFIFRLQGPHLCRETTRLLLKGFASAAHSGRQRLTLVGRQRQVLLPKIPEDPFLRQGS